MKGVDGVENSEVVVRMSTKDLLKQQKTSWFSAFQTFGVISWLVILYAFYAGFFVALLKIALEIRKDNYMTLNSKLGGSATAPDAYVTPWIWLKNNLPAGGAVPAASHTSG
ncbi:hypothetical protein HYH03_001819 [Edaphochlamys debaryana]|uniref:Uncharacterized protein n=1 Tax=Edaphochlamys debaryana TaxID=47281 RepID=A0A835YG00_9CHLO|nr:hypothetical protein HYH03_001819 [Edaphochlamys debaryana]|eukprot:KAG2500241.1 hypothetical protein HYH03_001819 [Edaphochlamys debaryana]